MNCILKIAVVSYFIFNKLNREWNTKQNNEILLKYVVPQDGEREFCDEHISCPDVDSIRIQDYGFVILAGEDKTVPVLSINISSSGARVTTVQMPTIFC